MPSLPSVRIPLTRIPSELAVLTGKTPPSYRKLYSKVLDGLLPDVVQDESGRYSAPEASLPRIAAAVGLTPTAPEPARAQRAPSNAVAA